MIFLPMNRLNFVPKNSLPSDWQLQSWERSTNDHKMSKCKINQTAGIFQKNLPSTDHSLCRLRNLKRMILFLSYSWNTIRVIPFNIVIEYDELDKPRIFTTKGFIFLLSQMLQKNHKVFYEWAVFLQNWKCPGWTSQELPGESNKNKHGQDFPRYWFVLRLTNVSRLWWNYFYRVP